MPDCGQYYAYLAAVGDYEETGCCDLPSRRNDQELIRQGLMAGLKFREENIRAAGHDGYVSMTEFASAMADYRDKLTPDDVMILYFSGHGRDGQIMLSNGALLIRDMIDYVSKLPARGKVVILDCCCAGVAEAGPPKQMLPEDTLEQFAGHGIAVMASASSGESARLGIPPDHSLYTAALSAAMQIPRLIKKGQLSLHDLNREVCALVEDWNEHHPMRRQSPVFRASMGGTIFFPVAEWQEKRSKFIRQDHDGYEIHDEQDLSTGRYRRVAVFVRTDEGSDEALVRITHEVAGHHAGCNVVWCYFGHDGSDMLRHVFFADTVMAPDEENRRIHFKAGKNSAVIGDICIRRNTSYDMVRELQRSALTVEEYRTMVTGIRAELLTIAEALIAGLQEVENGVISFGSFRADAGQEIRRVKQLYYQLSGLPPAHDAIYEWAESVQEIAGWILDMIILVDDRNEAFDDRRRWLILESIRRYHSDLRGSALTP